MLGEQIRMKRRSLGLSLQGLADEIALNGMPITRAALSNYERNKTVPSDSILSEIAKALGTSIDFLKHGDFGNVDIVFFDEPDMIAKRRSELTSYIKLCLDSQFLLDETLGKKQKFSFPDPVAVPRENLSLAEQIAAGAREQFRLGEMPIASVIGTLESNGWYVFELAKKIHLKLVSGIISQSRHPFLAFGDFRSTVVLRHELLKELAKVYIRCPRSADMDLAAERFASAMLIPASCVFEEFGEKRRHISFYELSIAKQKYGLSRMKLAERLEDLGVISKETKEEIVGMMQKTFLLKRNPAQDTVAFYEYPEALRMKCLRADAEEMLPEEYKEALGFLPD